MVINYIADIEQNAKQGKFCPYPFFFFLVGKELLSSKSRDRWEALPTRLVQRMGSREQLKAYAPFPKLVKREKWEMSGLAYQKAFLRLAPVFDKEVILGWTMT